MPRVVRREMVHATLPHPKRHRARRSMIAAVPRPAPSALHVPRRMAPATHQPPRQPVLHLDSAQRRTALSRRRGRKAARDPAAAPIGSSTAAASWTPTAHREATTGHSAHTDPRGSSIPFTTASSHRCRLPWLRRAPSIHSLLLRVPRLTPGRGKVVVDSSCCNSGGSSGPARAPGEGIVVPRLPILRPVPGPLLVHRTGCCRVLVPGTANSQPLRST